MDDGEPSTLVRLLLWVVRATPLGRGSAKRWIHAMIARLHPGPIASIFHGAPVLLHHHDNVMERKALLQPKVVDRKEIGFLKDAMRDGGVFVDIGANAGLYTLAVAQAAPAGSKIIAFEPNPVMADRLAANIGLNRRVASGDIVIELVRCAVGPVQTSLPLRTAHGDHGEGSLIANIDSEASFEVPVRTLLDLLAENTVAAVAALKIDVEGYEAEALGPFLDTAPSELLPKAIVIEHNGHTYWSRPLIEELRALGYQRKLKTRINTCLARPAAH